jgi:DNA helicase II / ATP-dependent DNA helicase PcrA
MFTIASVGYLNYQGNFPLGFLPRSKPMPKSAFVLTSEQEKVIAHRGGHLQVIACAGAGKTEAISRRVSSLIEEGVEPAQIVAFTFTERAATALKTRIARRIAEAKGQAFLDRLGPMFVGTIHAYCLHMLQDHVPEFGNFDILDKNKLAGLVSREHKRLMLDRLGLAHWRSIVEFLRNADVIENELIDPQRITGTPFGDCYIAFKQMLFRYHFLTYGQLISEAVKALARPAVFERVHGPLKHLIVDEYQDINPAQEKLISLLAKPPVHLCVVADDDQAIYQWRGSDVSNMLDFTKRYRPAKSLPLSANRRSRPKIISTANAIAELIYPRLPKKMKSHRPANGLEVHCWAAETGTVEAEVIADTIKKLRKKGYRYEDIAILFRSVRTSSPPLIEIFKKRDIPFRCAGRTGLFMQPEATVLGKTYAWLLDNEWKNERYGDSYPVNLDGLITEFQDVFNVGKKIASLKQYLGDWKAEVNAANTPVNLVRDLYRLFNLLGVQHFDLNNALTSARLGCLARFSQILADFEHVKRRARYVEEGGEFRGGQDRGIWFYRQLFNYLQFYALDAYEDFEGEDTFDLDAVDILTVHQAKGLEWPVVFLPGLVQGRFPSKYAGKAQDWLIPDSIFPAEARSRYEGGRAEERRLFYVAVTRAKDVVYLSRPRRKINKFQPSPYLREVAGGDPDVAENLPLPEPFVPPLDEEAGRATISFSELASYEDCPLRYRLSSSFGFQPQLATELGYGKAIHHILRRIAELAKAKKKLPTVADVEKVFKEGFYLPFAQKFAFERLFNEAKKLVGKYLKTYSSDLLRVWETERPFELHLANGIVSGRADVILDMEGGRINSLALVDYKTANDEKGDNVFTFQLAVYAAAGRGEGLDVSAAYLHHLNSAERRTVDLGGDAVKNAQERADKLIDGIVQGKFPAQPGTSKCRGCDVRAVCKHAKCSSKDF